MIIVKCLHKFRNKNNQIIGYTIQDKNGNTVDVKSEYLKQAIRNSQIKVLNLTLTSDNKLIDKAYKPQKVQKVQNNNLKNIIAKISVLGTPFTSPCGHTYYIIKKTDTTIVAIPNDVKELNSLNLECNTLKIIGGSGLESTYEMFDGCRIKSLDLSTFDTSNVTDMSKMFYECETQSLNLSTFDTSKVTNMYLMFYRCQAKSLDLSSFDTSKVTDMGYMFARCQAKSLDLSSFDTSNVTDMSYMFARCQAKSLDLSSFDTSKVTDMERMFPECKVQSLDLSSFDTSNVTKMGSMFYGCEAQSIDLSSFDTSYVLDMANMFEKCKAQIKTNDSKLEYQLQYDRDVLLL